MGVKTYDPKMVKVTFGEQFMTGHADGKFVTVKRRADTFKLTVGASGEGARAKSNDQSGEIEMVILQTSAFNDYLSSVALLDELTNSGKKPFLMQDLNGRTIYRAQTAWIVKPPDGEFSKEITERTWKLETDSLEVFNGGNL